MGLANQSNAQVTTLTVTGHDVDVHLGLGSSLEDLAVGPESIASQMVSELSCVVGHPAGELTAGWWGNKSTHRQCNQNDTYTHL